MQWLSKLRLENPPISNRNARVCSDHFKKDNFVGSIVPGFGPTKRTLKPDAAPTKFCFVPIPKRQKTSEARIARAEHQDTIEHLTTPLLTSPSIAISSEEVMESDVPPVKPTTRDVEIQCG